MFTRKFLFNIMLGVLFAVSVAIVAVVAATAAEAKTCHDGTVRTYCPPPAPIKGPVKSTKKFEKECAWLPFPVGKVGKPVVFFTKESDARCIGKRWKRNCPECTDWIHGKRGPINGPARNARVALRLHNGMTGVSVPRDAFARIRRDAGWCWMGKSGMYDSHRFNEKPF